MATLLHSISRAVNVAPQSLSAFTVSQRALSHLRASGPQYWFFHPLKQPHEHKFCMRLLLAASALVWRHMMGPWTRCNNPVCPARETGSFFLRREGVQHLLDSEGQKQKTPWLLGTTALHTACVGLCLKRESNSKNMSKSWTPRKRLLRYFSLNYLGVLIIMSIYIKHTHFKNASCWLRLSLNYFFFFSIFKPGL